MAYSKTVWANDTTPAINQTNLNKLEQGVYDSRDSTNIAFTASGAGAVERTVSAKLKDFVSVRDFGAVGDGVEDDTAAIQAAIDVAEAFSEGFLGGGSAGVYFPDGEYRVSGLTIQQDGIALFGSAGRGAKIVTNTDAGHTLITVGYSDFSDQVYHVSISNLTIVADSTIANRTDTIGIRFYDSISCYINNVVFNNFAVSIDGYRFNTSVCTNIQFRQHNRSTANAEAAIRLSGRSTDGSTSGNNHFSNVQILGSGATADVIYNAGFQVLSVDGLYVENSHIYKCDYDVRFAPNGTNAGNMIEGVIFDGVYLDEPGTACVMFAGSTADIGVPTKIGYYQNIHFDNCYMRGAASQDAGTTFASYLVRCQVDAVSANGLDNIKFSGGTYRMSNICPFYFQGQASGDVEAENVIIDGITAIDNNQGGAGTYSLLSGELGSLTLINNTIGADANAAASVVQAVVSSNQGAVISGNNLINSTFTGTDPFVITNTEGVLAHITDNKFPDTGRTVNQTYYLETTDATQTTVFSHTLQTNMGGVIKAKVLMTSEAGTRVRYNEKVVVFRHIGAGVVIVGSEYEPIDESVNPSTTAIDIGFSSDDVVVQVTGIAAETIKWSVSIEMVVE